MYGSKKLAKPGGLFTTSLLQWHPHRPALASVSSGGLVHIWSIVTQEKWGAFAAHFEELEENVIYEEKEDEFDIVSTRLRSYQTTTFLDFLSDPVDRKTRKYLSGAKMRKRIKTWTSCSSTTVMISLLSLLIRQIQKKWPTFIGWRRIQTMIYRLTSRLPIPNLLIRTDMSIAIFMIRYMYPYTHTLIS